MNVLMISHRHPSFAGDKSGGGDADAAVRHAIYGEHVEHLDIIMHSSRQDDYSVHKLAQNVTVYPTNSLYPVLFIKDAMAIAGGIAQNHKPDLIVASDPFILGLVGARLKKKFNAPLLVHFHGDFWDNPYFLIEHPKNRLLVPLSKRIVKNADGVRAVSGIIAEKIKKVFPDKLVEVIPTPVDLDKFGTASEDAVREIKKQYGENLILFVGRLEVEKNVQMLLNAFHLVSKEKPDARILIIGNGTELGMLRKYAHDQGWNNAVFFRGNISHDDLPAYYHAAKVLALPSNSESFGKVISEAAASKLPAVATRTAGGKTLIDDGRTGFLVNIGDTQEFAKKIIMLLQDENLRAAMGQTAFEHAKQYYSAEENTKKIIELWKRMTAK